MDQTKLTLHYAPGACSQVTHIALEELGLPFELHAVNLMSGENRSPEFKALSPLGKVPVLTVKGSILTETLAILRWLDGRHPGILMPSRGADSLASAQDWSLLSFFAATVHPVFTRFRVPPAIIADPAQFPAVAAHAAPVLAEFFAFTSQRLDEGEWLLGTFSAADIYAAWLWSEAVGAGFDASAFPSLERLRDQVHQRPAVRRALQREASALLHFGAPTAGN